MKLTNKKNVILNYLIILFILSYLWQLIIFFTGGVDSKFFVLLMFFPAIVAIVFRIISKEGFQNIGWVLRKWRYVIPAILIPIIVVFGIVLLLLTLNLATLPDKFFIFKDGMLEFSFIGLILGNHTQGIPFFILNFTFSHIVFLIMGSIITLGEEFGWRGYLQEKFLRKFGLNWGLILLGIVWGYWHLPLVLLMGWTFPNHPVLGAFLLFPISTVFSGIFVGWLYLRSRSIWMPALAHASLNLFTGFLFLMSMSQEDALFAKLILLVGWGIVAALCLVSLNRNKPVLWQAKNKTK